MDESSGLVGARPRLMDEARRKELIIQEHELQSVGRTRLAGLVGDLIRAEAALSVAEARNQDLEQTGKCVACVTGEEKGPAVLCRFCVQEIREELEAHIGRLRYGIHAIGVHARKMKLEAVNAMTESLLASTPAQSAERLRKAERAAAAAVRLVEMFQARPKGHEIEMNFVEIAMVTIIDEFAALDAIERGKKG